MEILSHLSKLRCSPCECPDSKDHLTRVLGQIFATCHELCAFYKCIGNNLQKLMHSKYFDRINIPHPLQDARYGLLQCSRRREAIQIATCQQHNARFFEARAYRLRQSAFILRLR